MKGKCLIFGVLLVASSFVVGAEKPSALVRLTYNNPGLIVDLGAGLWAYPLPMDYDKDGDNDLLVVTPDVPYNGLYFFENVEGNVKYPTFKAARRLDDGPKNAVVSYIGEEIYVMMPEALFPDFRSSNFEKPSSVPFKPTFHVGRDNQWKVCDYDGDGVNDLILGISDWRDYGWDNAFNEKGEWTRGPLHGFVYFVRNTGSNDAPKYAEPVKVEADGKAIDVYGCPSPNFADFDKDGDLDLICGEFLDKITYFENTGDRQNPKYAAGRFLEQEGQILRVDLEMMQVIAVDWDKDGDTDLVVGQEDGRVALMENTGNVTGGMPDFLPAQFFKQEADCLKTGALSTPSSVDWDGDGDEDLIVGNTAGYISFVENLDGGNPPKWAEPVYLKSDGKVIRIQAGANGSIQGPAEAKWGYTILNAADWDLDGLPDIVINSIWGEVIWYRNTGTRQKPELAAAQPVEVEWQGTTPKPKWNWWNPKGKQLVTQWRTTPCLIDLDRDGLVDLVMLDQEGYLSFFKRDRKDGILTLQPGERIFSDDAGNLLRMNDKEAGKSGRRTFTMVDWDLDGKVDIIADGKNMQFLKNVSTDEGRFTFKNTGDMDSRKLAGHATCPTVVDWDRNRIPDLLIGAEDGFFYYLRNPGALSADSR